MTAQVFVDSNVLIYASDPRDLRKMKASTHWLRSLWNRKNAAVSPQILNEYYNVSTRLAPGLDKAVARRDLRRFQQWHVVMPDQEFYELAFAVQDRFRFSWWDCLIVAAAKRGGCTHLLTEDLQHGQDLGGLSVVSPFRIAPEAVLAG